MVLQDRIVLQDEIVSSPTIFTGHVSLEWFAAGRDCSSRSDLPSAFEGVYMCAVDFYDQVATFDLQVSDAAKTCNLGIAGGSPECGSRVAELSLC